MRQAPIYPVVEKNLDDELLYDSEARHESQSQIVLDGPCVTARAETQEDLLRPCNRLEVHFRKFDRGCNRWLFKWQCSLEFRSSVPADAIRVEPGRYLPAPLRLDS